MIAKHWRFQPGGVSIAWENGHHSEYPSVWLFDNDPVRRDPRTGQRLADVADLPLNPSLENAQADGEVLRLAWADGSATGFRWDWLLENCPCPAHGEAAPLRLWTASDGQLLRRFDYTAIRSSQPLRLDWLETASSAGIAFLSGVPAEEGAVLEVAALVAWVRETNYGRVFNVRAVPDPNNLAYTNLALGLHTDNPYRDPVPGLQILHCLRAGRVGGASLFADGFAVAEALRCEDAEAYRLLISTRVRFAFTDALTSLAAIHPILQHDSEGKLEAVHYNSRSTAPIRMAPGTIPEFYRAYTTFARLLRDSRFILTTTLAEGDLVLFNNRRVLHGRSSYPSVDARHLRGCYLDQDGLLSHIAVLRRNGHR